LVDEGERKIRGKREKETIERNADGKKEKRREREK
jgi:hypothetical protein